MTIVRSQIVQTVRSSDPARDACVNDVYHSVAAGIVWGGVDFQNHANEIRDLFSGLNTTSGKTFTMYGNRALTIKVYDMADLPPRPIKAQATHVPTTFESAPLAPRQLACCLSYYGSNRGRPSERGRIYIGPFLLANAAETVPQAIQDELCDLGHGLFDIGGQNVAHIVHSPTKKTDTVVHNYWCNDLWDNMSSREEREGHRTVLAP